ncbi:germin-like protein 2-1 isoform X1 [Canna indica]|uniref:Germin-like protein n=1 Tax=Canna indica TaxID=4628 RepID=A0AAQ3Q4W2_9LILI|nr:germin-like protein 2-1 isoform X1 [Canna indica]
MGSDRARSWESPSSREGKKVWEFSRRRSNGERGVGSRRRFGRRRRCGSSVAADRMGSEESGVAADRMGSEESGVTIDRMGSEESGVATDRMRSEESGVAVDSGGEEVFVNGYALKNPNDVTSDDFFSGFETPGSTDNYLGSNITLVNVQGIPGLNMLGVAMSRIDFAPRGLNPPHSHPRSRNGNLLFAKKLQKGDVFVFPQGLIHFLFNYGESSAVAKASFNSQNPGLVTTANALFGSNPAIDAEVLAKAFQLDKETVDWLQSKNWVDNSGEDYIGALHQTM